MKKLFAFTKSWDSAMGGRDTSIGAFTTYELAKEAREAMKKRSRNNPCAPRAEYSDIVELTVYESRDEIPFL